MQRAYDNIIHDVAIQSLPVVMCLDRGGLVGEDGATHHGVFDLACLATVPNLIIAAPRNELELRNLMYTAKEASAPFVIRYPRGTGAGVAWRNEPFAALTIGKGELLKEGDTIAILSIGTTASLVDEALSSYPETDRVAHYDMRYAKPLDLELLEQISTRFDKIITIEDGAIRGGVGQTIAAQIARSGASPKIITLGIPDNFVEHATQRQLYAECGYDPQSIRAAIDSLLN